MDSEAERSFISFFKTKRFWAFLVLAVIMSPILAYMMDAAGYPRGLIFPYIIFAPFYLAAVFLMDMLISFILNSMSGGSLYNPDFYPDADSASVFYYKIYSPYMVYFHSIAFILFSLIGLAFIYWHYKSMKKLPLILFFILFGLAFLYGAFIVVASMA